MCAVDEYLAQQSLTMVEFCRVAAHMQSAPACTTRFEVHVPASDRGRRQQGEVGDSVVSTQLLLQMWQCGVDPLL